MPEQAPGTEVSETQTPETNWEDYVKPLPILNPEKTKTLMGTLYVYVPQETVPYTFFGEFSFDKDAEDCMGTGTLRMPYHPTLWSFWEPGFQELEIKGGSYDQSTLFKGRTRGIKQDGQNIEIALQDCGWRLKQQYEGDRPKGSVAENFKKVVEKAGMIPVISGLKEDYQIKTGEDETGTISGSGTGGTAGKYNLSSGSSGSGGGDGKCDNNLTSAVHGKAYMINGCAGNYDQDTVMHDWGPWVNWCPVCGASGYLIVHADMPGRIGIVCTYNNCDVDHSCVHGFGTKAYDSSGTLQGNMEGGTPACGEQLIGCGNNPYNNQGGSASGSGGSEDETSTYEELIQDMCEGNDLLFYTDFNNQCILYDYPSLMDEIDKKCFHVENWMIKYPSFVLDVNQFGFYNTVEITYSGGTIKESYEDLVDVYGEIIKKYDEPDKNKIEATTAAKARLATLLRDFAMEIQAEVLHSGALLPGTFCSLENPISNNRETYYISGISVTQTPKDNPMNSLTLLYAPKNPEVTDIPEIAGTSGGSGANDLGTGGTTSWGKGMLNNLSGTAGLVKLQEYIYKYLDHDYGAGTTATIVENTGRGDCWGLSEWTANVLHDNGYKVRIVMGTSSETTNHEWVQYMCNGQWEDFDPSLVTKSYSWGQPYSTTCATVREIIKVYD